jgi:hypothetical protein
MLANRMQKLLWSNDLLDGFSKNPVVSNTKELEAIS